MSAPALQAQVDAAKVYESLFVPALFGQWAPEIGDAARVQPGQRVLDVACGTGVLARAILARTGPSGQVVGLDPNPGMLAVASELAPAVTWRQGAAESMPFPDQSFDAVVSQFGLMFFQDRQQAVREMLPLSARESRRCSCDVHERRRCLGRDHNPPRHGAVSQRSRDGRSGPQGMVACDGGGPHGGANRTRP